MAVSDRVNPRPTQEIVGPLRSLVDVSSSTAVGTVFSLGAARDEFGVQLVGTGTTEATVQLQGAIVSSGEAGTTAVWKQIGSDITWDSTAAPVLVRVSPAQNTTGYTPVHHVRLVCTAFTTGTSTATDALSGWISVR